MSPVQAVLFDRDGTLVHDVPYNGDPDLVRPVDGAREAVALLREHGIRVGVVTNQSGVARGLLTDTDVRRVNRRIDELVGPFDVWAVCPHGPDDGCHCRKPRPGMILWAAGRVCAAPADCVVIGDIGADMEAAEHAGAHGILVPNDRTRPRRPRPPPMSPQPPDRRTGRPRRSARGPGPGGRAAHRGGVRREHPGFRPRPPPGRPRRRGGPLACRRRHPREAAMKALVTRLDSFGDVLLAGPAVRAVAARADHVTLLCGSRGAPPPGCCPAWTRCWSGTPRGAASGRPTSTGPTSTPSSTGSTPTRRWS